MIRNVSSDQLLRSHVGNFSPQFGAFLFRLLMELDRGDSKVDQLHASMACDHDVGWRNILMD